MTRVYAEVGVFRTMANAMRYIRMYLGGEAGEPGLTLYEIDAGGWVHRQVQIHAEGSRFSPEDILMQRPVNPDYMASHPAAEEIRGQEFERLWREVHGSRAFLDRIPDPGLPWEGWVDQPEGAAQLRWVPSGDAPDHEWYRVPGFTELFVRGTSDPAWSIQRLVFLERPIHWCAPERHQTRVA